MTVECCHVRSAPRSGEAVGEHCPLGATSRLPQVQSPEVRPDQIHAIARHVQEGYERSARRRHHRSTGHWNNGMALAGAVGQAVGEALTDLSQRVEPGEA